MINGTLGLHGVLLPPVLLKQSMCNELTSIDTLGDRC
jgi:hypothetical protein